MMSPRLRKQLQKVRDKVDYEEGLSTFVYYGDFPEIRDPEFRRLVDNYVEAHEKLAAYLDKYTKGEGGYRLF